METMESTININIDSDKEIKEDNPTEDENTEFKNYSIWEIEEFLKNNQLPPGIKAYEDMPPGIPLQASESKISKAKKPWETEENIVQFNNLFIDNECNEEKVAEENNTIEK